MWGKTGSREGVNGCGMNRSVGNMKQGIDFPCSSGVENLGGKQKEGMVYGVMILGHRETFLSLSAGAFSPNMMSPILKLYSVTGSSRLVLSTDTRIFSTTHMGSTSKICNS